MIRNRRESRIPCVHAAVQIARRFLWRSRFQSALIILGIGVGIGTQVFVGSLIASLQASLIDTTVGNSPHVTLEAQSEGNGVDYTDRLRQRLEADPAIVAVVPQHVVSVLAAAGDRTDPLVMRVNALFRTIHARTNTTFVIVTHDVGVAEQADRTIEVCDGRIASDRTA